MKSLGVFNGMDIRINGKDFISLTDMWKAAGSDSSKHPQKWQRLPHAKQFIELLAKKDEWRKSPVIITVRGRGKPQGTYGHWQVALAYAKYLSPEFHMWCNEVVRQVLTVDPRLVESLIDLTEDPEALERYKLRADSKLSYFRLRDAVGTQCRKGRIVNYSLIRRISNRANYVATGKWTNEIREERGITSGMTRDAFTNEELAAVSFTNNLAADNIRRTDPRTEEEIDHAALVVQRDVFRLIRKYSGVSA